MAYVDTMLQFQDIIEHLHERQDAINQTRAMFPHNQKLQLELDRKQAALEEKLTETVNAQRAIVLLN